jgi:hypothetical protein
MRRLFHLALGGWFLFAMTMAQACVPPTQSREPYSKTAQGSSVGSTASTSTPAADENTRINTADYTPDKGESQALTSYLQQHRLPLVGAQVLDGTAGQHAIVLYGFVGTDFGKSDAAAKARRFVGDQSVAIDNRINVRPELLASGSSSGSTSAPDSQSQPSDNSYPGAQSYADQQKQAENQVQQYQQQQSSAGIATTVIPLIVLLGILGAGMAGGGGSSGFGSYGSPFGPSYPSYPSGPLYGYPFGGSPYGGSPYGGSPYGGSPYGGSPYGGSPYSPSTPYPYSYP